MTNEVRVVIPDEHYSLVTFQQDDLPGVACSNRGLVDFEPRIVFRWHLSILVTPTDLIDNGMLSTSEREIVDPFGDSLDEELKGPVPERPNALFLARITWNATRELVYRVHDPEAANSVLRARIRAHDHPREFEFRMEDDPSWSFARWHLEAAGPEGPLQGDDSSARG